MPFERDMETAAQYLSMEPSYIDPTQPTGLWFCDSIASVSDIGMNAVCLGSGCRWDDLTKCRAFIEAFPYVVIVSPGASARELLERELRPRLPASCIYTLPQACFRGCSSIGAFLRAYGPGELPSILDGAVELPNYGLLNLASVPRRDISSMPRVMSGFPQLDRAIAGFFPGELSVWTGKRGQGKSTLLGQILLESIDQGHKVCAYSGELGKEQFRQWIYLQAAGAKHVTYQTDKLSGKQLAEADALADKLISRWLDEKFWLFDLDVSSSHDEDVILGQFQYARMRYLTDVFIVDNIMTVGLKGARESDYWRAQSNFAGRLVQFAKKHQVHVHLVVHPRKSGRGKADEADDVGGSGDITNRADNLFWLKRETRDIKGDGHITQEPVLHVMKNRDFGASGAVPLLFDRASRRFYPDKNGDPNKQYGWDHTGEQLPIPTGKESL